MKLNRKGLVLLPLFWFIVAGVVTVIEFGAMIYDMSCMDCSYRGRGDGGSF